MPLNMQNTDEQSNLLMNSSTYQTLKLLETTQDGTSIEPKGPGTKPTPATKSTSLLGQIKRPELPDLAIITQCADEDSVDAALAWLNVPDQGGDSYAER